MSATIRPAVILLQNAVSQFTGFKPVHFPRLGCSAMRNLEMTASGIPAKVIETNAWFGELRCVGFSDSEILTVAGRGDAVFVCEHSTMRGNAVKRVVATVGFRCGVVILSRMTGTAL